MTYRIYCHLNTFTRKSYVGYTKLTLLQRWEVHLKLMRRGSNLLFHNSIRKHGESCWQHEVICDHVNTLQEAKLLEKHFIEVLNTYGVHGYNMTLGGDGCPPGSQKGRVFSIEHREKLRLAKLGKKTGRKIPPEMAAARRAMKGTDGPRIAAKLSWQRRRERMKQ